MNSDFVPGLAIGAVLAIFALFIPYTCDSIDLFLQKKIINQTKPCAQLELIKVNNFMWVCDGKEWRLVK